MAAVEQDHSGAGAEQRPLEGADRLFQAVQAHEPGDRRRLAAGNDQAVEMVQLLRLAHLDGLGAQPAQHRGVLAEVPLHREDSDFQRLGHLLDSSLALYSEAASAPKNPAPP